VPIKPEQDFLGSTPAFPFREADAGLPDLAFVSGEAAVAAGIGFLLRTAPGDLPFDPELGMDPEVLRFDPADPGTASDAHAMIAASIIRGEPRATAVRPEIVVDPHQNRLDIHLAYRTIQRDVPGNQVRLPSGKHEDILKQPDTRRLAIQGYFDSITIALGIGRTGSA